MMKHLLTAIACFFALSMSAQSDVYPFNPDSDADGIIGVSDLLALLSDFGEEAELETCFRGESYFAHTWNSIPVQNIIYIPEDAGVVECLLDSGYAKYRMPNSVPEGTVVYFFLTRDSFYSNAPFVFEQYVNTEWTAFYSQSGHGDHKAKLTYNGGTWTGEGQTDVVLPRASE